MQPSAVTTAVDSDSLTIPLIDFSAFLSNPDPQTKKSTADAIVSGFRDAGFIYLRNHGLPAPFVADTFAQSASFFKRPAAQKEQLAWTTPEANRGYIAHGREKVSDASGDEVTKLRETEGQDLKESLEIGREGEEGHPNSWPDGLDQEGVEFKRHMLEFFGKCKDLHVQVMRAIAVGLGIDETWFDGFCDKGDNTLRLLHYPEVSAEVFRRNAMQVRAGAHTDYGSITLLFQDQAGGLQVRSPKGTFVDATPIEGTIVVNAGDLLARWSNDSIKSTKHRVVEPPKPAESDVHPARYSIAYFCNPNFDRWIEGIPGTGEAGGKKYEGINRCVCSMLLRGEGRVADAMQWRLPGATVDCDVLSRQELESRTSGKNRILSVDSVGFNGCLPAASIWSGSVLRRKGLLGKVSGTSRFSLLRFQSSTPCCSCDTISSDDEHPSSYCTSRLCTQDLAWVGTQYPHRVESSKPSLTASSPSKRNTASYTEFGGALS